MPIQLYNTLSRKIETFEPLRGREVRMYTCGLTVYDYGHIGNFRTFIGMDVLQRFLISQGYNVNSAMNITDVDDKMIQRSNEAGRELREYADFYTAAFLEDLKLLEVLPARHLVRATDFIPQMVSWIEKLIAGGHAYESEGSVYFRVASFAAYGRLSGKDMAGLQDGARVNVDEYEKEQARDFVLWKARREGEPSWPSPWGEGRPGWHIECSVMAEALLGETIDIHAGGTDLIFPHHENEIAQVEPVTGQPFVRFWVHSEFLLVNGEKMSKRSGNFFTVRDLMAKGYHPSAIRFLLASVPYRRQLNFTLEGLQQATASVERLRAFRHRVTRESLPPGEEPILAAATADAQTQMTAALADNLNTAEALAAIFDLVTAGNKALDAGSFRAENQGQVLAVLGAFDQVFQVLAGDDHAKMQVAHPGQTAARAFSREEVEQLLERRNAARQARDFGLADALRRQLDEAGVLVEDIKGGGARWRWK